MATDQRREAMDDVAGLDLNMLTALRALLQERSVTRASARLGLGQPATSAALRRLRAHFGDELLMRHGSSYGLTPLASSLLPSVEQAVIVAEDVLLSRTKFDPGTSTRTFTVMASDVALVQLGEQLIPSLGDAPNIKLDFIALTDAAMQDVEVTLRNTDALIVPRGEVAEFPSVDLWTDRWAYMVGERSPLTAETLTMERLAEMTWVSSFHGAATPVAAALDAWKLRPRIRVTVPTYVSLPLLLAKSSDHIAIIQRRLAQRLRALDGVRVLPGPPDAPEIRVALWWHPTHDRDAGHAWLRNRILDCTRSMRSPGLEP
jgi:DNA-binding transcriptional LysR family regulator